MPAVPPRHPRRVAFLGTPDAAVPSLRALAASELEVALVVSRPDRRRGRGGATSPSPVKAAALELGLPVTDQVDEVVGAGVDLGVVVAYGRILRADLLDAVPMVNVHFSLLPRWRGAAPVERALLAGDARTGVCVMEVVEALDEGGVHARAEVPIGPEATAAGLRAELAELGAELLVRTLTSGLGTPEPQEGEATYAAKITPDDLHLDWTRPAPELDRVVRVGGAWTTFRDARLRVWAATPTEGDATAGGPGAVAVVDGAVVAATGAGALVLDEVQPEGRARQAARDWANGARLAPDDRLGP
ncbi:methionyl-tRNA formyltransferase [Iamia majanohamensis]|uniref:Methionyl-tRNA formyltransferase n=1 Tax=Iamia majanohamensis TaxID=467976 RepID=A0AAE9Y388_9ACTN|nr:methionyl-tRNA formyltransferase [Iamia majanohamensis]WCO65142.1 methionyl-tRNA formyltransferase [Iamia majanohamensis]